MPQLLHECQALGLRRRCVVLWVVDEGLRLAPKLQLSLQSEQSHMLLISHLLLLLTTEVRFAASRRKTVGLLLLLLYTVCAHLLL